MGHQQMTQSAGGACARAADRGGVDVAEGCWLTATTVDNIIDLNLKSCNVLIECPMAHVA